MSICLIEYALPISMQVKDFFCFPPFFLSTLSQSLFGKREFYLLKYFSAYVETAHAYAFQSGIGSLTVPPGSPSPVNRKK